MSTRRLRLVLLTASTLGLAVVGACGGPSAASTPAMTVTVTSVAPAVTVTLIVEVTGAASTVTVDAPPATAFRDGQFIVGRDIQPGTYRASAGSDICYWERQDQGGELIDNGFGTVATIRSSDFSFQSNRCGSWSRVG